MDDPTADDISWTWRETAEQRLRALAGLPPIPRDPLAISLSVAATQIRILQKRCSSLQAEVKRLRGGGQ